MIGSNVTSAMCEEDELIGQGVGVSVSCHVTVTQSSVDGAEKGGRAVVMGLLEW